MDTKLKDAGTLDGNLLGTEVWRRSRFWILNTLLLATAFSLGWRLHSGVRVQAQSAGNVFFQITGMKDADALILYYPEQKSIYV